MSKNESKKSILKRIYIFLLMVVTVVGLVACSQKNSDTSYSNATSALTEEIEKSKTTDNIGKFETTDLDKNKVTQDVFKENDLTMVNLLSSTCNPCMEELPHLAELSNEYKDKKVGVLGVNIDIDSSGNPDENSRKLVSEVLSKKNSNMKVIFLDENLMNKLLTKTDALPFTLFVDKNGDIVGEEYLGDRSKEDWAKIINKELKNISKNNKG